jgi:Uncharacterised protein family (UPF0158)
MQSDMDSEEQRSALRAAVYRGDGRAVVEVLGGVGADDGSLQLAGDGVIAAVMQGVDGAAELARELVVGLRQRGWGGDDELAGILEGDPLSVGGRIDIRTGEVWPQAAIEYGVETGEEDEDATDDPERWLPVYGEGSREGYRDMELFIASVEDPGRAERLAVAIRGRGAFRRFKDELARWPGELARWHAFSEERQRGRARSWLAASGYRVLPVDRRDSCEPGHRRAISLSEAHLQAARRDARHTREREAEGVLRLLVFHRASRACERQGDTWPRAARTWTRCSLPRWAARHRRGR